MEEKHLKNIYPIAWVRESRIFSGFINKWYSDSEDNLLVADFASGEYDRIPTFFTKILPELNNFKLEYEKRIVVYCTDVHALRLESLQDKIIEDNLLDNVRLVHTALETMDKKAKLLELCEEYISTNSRSATWLDDFLIGEKQFPPECFDIGILNNDVVGYLFEYYKEYSNAPEALLMIWRLIRHGGILIVTMPCLQYKVDNISILESTGFSFLEGVDITLSTQEKASIGKDVSLTSLSRLGHYSYLIFSKS